MQRQAYEFVDVSGGKYELPITLKQSNAKLTRVPGLLLMTGLATVIVAPQIALAGYGIASSEVRRALLEHPVVSLELALALITWIGLVCWPLRNILLTLMSDRIVDIRNGEITVIDKTPFMTRTWRLPLTTYEGIALHVRSSLSGVRHEAVLVHPYRAHSVILMVAERIGEPEIAELCRILKLPSISVERLYDLGSPPRRGRTPDDLAPAVA
jgi:hypothetical protein